MKLDEIARIWDEIERDLEESGGEETPEIAQKLAFFNFVEAEKIDAYGAVIKDLEYRAKATKEQAAELELKAKRLERHVEWLTRRLRDFAESRGLQEVKGRIFTAGWRKNGGAAPVEIHEVHKPADYSELPLVRTKHEWNKEIIRDAILDEKHPCHHTATAIANIGERGATFKVRV
jgi:hypothetical protein